MKTGMLCAVLLCSASAGFVAWRVHAVKARQVPHFELVEDPSLSRPQGCESLVGLAEQTLRAVGVSSSSTLTVLVIGDEATANEPWRLGRYSIPASRKILEGRSASLRRQQETLRDIWNKCQALRRTTVSPIFLGVKQAVADLRAQGCKENSRCQVFVDSDLEENAEIAIRKSLANTADRKRILPSPINNEHIEVVFCNVAVAAGRIVDPSGREIPRAFSRDSHREDRLREIWRSLFTQSETVEFEPYCPNPSDLGTYTASHSSTKEDPACSIGARCK